MKLLISFVLLIVGLSGQAQNAVNVIEGKIVIPERGSLSFVEDEGKSLAIEQVSNLSNWNSIQQDVPNFFISNSRFWIKTTVRNGTNDDRIVLSIHNPTLDKVGVIYKKDGEWVSQELNDYSKISDRVISESGYVFAVDIDKGQIADLYIYSENTDQIQLPIKFGTTQTITRAASDYFLVYAVYIGILLSIFLMNFFIAINTKEKSYILYIFYLITLVLTQSNFQGYSLKEIIVLPYIERHLVFVYSGLVGIVSGFFMFEFLNLREKKPKFIQTLRVFTVIYMAEIALAMLGFEQLAYLILQITASLWASILMITSYRQWRLGSKQAFHFFIAWSAFLSSVILFALKDYSLVPYNFFTSHAMIFGSAIEGVVLSIALADKINVLKREKEEAQAREIEVMRLNQEAIERQNIILEIKVHERTQDLEKANEDLSNTLSDLKITQKQLLESEKLASLGQMTAGIAHEINNPINFVSSNIQPLKRDVSDILTLLDEYAQVSDLEQMREKLPTLQKRYMELDIDYLKREIDMLLQGIEEGSRRTAEIVRGLRIFSRMDRDALVTANINECLGSTLVVMKSITKGEVTLVRELQDDLPAIDCYPGKLNQVFMNVINNAVQATKLPGRSVAEREVHIRTFLRDENVCISVSDNGCGITDEVRGKIFDPFFTTKGVGEGTGLGLSIAMGIINEHHGRIEVSSEPNKGTEFLIILPRKIALAKAA